MMNYKKKPDKVFKIVADGMISTQDIGEGRFFPALIIDASDEPSIKELLAFHNTTPPGDTKTVWSKPLSSIFNNNKLILNVEFIKPMSVVFGIEFDLATQYFLVDGIIQAKGFMFQNGNKEDKVSTPGIDKIIIEVPNTGFEEVWEEFLLHNTLKKIYKKNRVAKKDLPSLVKTHIENMRKISNFRRSS